MRRSNTIQRALYLLEPSTESHHLVSSCVSSANLNPSYPLREFYLFGNWSMKPSPVFCLVSPLLHMVVINHSRNFQWLYDVEPPVVAKLCVKIVLFVLMLVIFHVFVCAKTKLLRTINAIIGRFERQPHEVSMCKRVIFSMIT